MKKSQLKDLTPEELTELFENNTTDFRWNRSDICKIAFEKYMQANNQENLQGYQIIKFFQGQEWI